MRHFVRIAANHFVHGFLTSAVLIFLSGWTPAQQEVLPSPPPDHTLIYVLDNQNNLRPLAFEKGTTPLNPETAARATKVSYIEFRGEHAATILGADQRIFVFTFERPGVHPPFIVWLTAKRGNRRVTAITEKGLTGFAIPTEEMIRPRVRVLAKNGDEVFMELRPRVSLMPGEYAIIGRDLTRVATFRVVSN